ncbi:MAG: 2-methylthioadenine synthetase, partial [Thermoprotei archaeon]
MKKGYIITNNIEEANVIIINTCTVRKDSESKMVKRLKKLRKYLNNGYKIIVAGCMAKAQPYLVSRLVPEASLVSPQNIDKICHVVESRERVVLLDGERSTSIVPSTTIGVIGMVPIADGCLNDCSFCIVKLARGKLRSYPPKLIVKTVEELVKKGAKEIEITAQDTATYGRDLSEKIRLPDLVNMICEIDGDFMIRIGQMNPQWMLDIIDDLVESLKNPKVYKYLHIPVQSGDNGVLEIMKRGYRVEDFEYIIHYSRSKIPNIQIATDIIVGHPGEDEDAFRNTLDLIMRIEPDKVHLAQYSIRPRTEAAAMPQIPEIIKKQRCKVLEEVIEKIGLDINKEYIGTKAKALITEKGFRPG